MKTSWRRCVAFSQFVNGFVANGQQFLGWLEQHPQESKLHYAIKRVMAQIESANGPMQIKIENLDIDNCATGEAGVILRNADGSLAFTRDGLKARNAARKELLDAEDIEIEPYFATELPELSEGELNVFRGFVVEDQKLSAVA